VVDAIEAAGKDRLKAGVSVYRIEQSDKEALVSYFNNRDGQLKTIACQAVILAVPYFFVPRVVQDLPQVTQAVCRGMRYESYLVANCCFNQRVFQGGYDHWTPDNLAFTDFITADYATHGNHQPKGQQTPFVLTVYAPFRNPHAGRAALLRGERQNFAQAIETALRERIGYPKGSLEEIRLTRYGHQLLTSRVGLVESLGRIKKNIGRIILAHSDGQGMASIESAITEAYGAIGHVKPLLTHRLSAIFSA
jgi:hypothetical protein